MGILLFLGPSLRNEQNRSILSLYAIDRSNMGAYKE